MDHRKANQRYRLAALSVYSKGAMECASCGFKDALTIDHVNNDGAAWRKEHGVKAGQNTYFKLYKLGYPDGFQVLCFNCNWLKEDGRRRR